MPELYLQCAMSTKSWLIFPGTQIMRNRTETYNWTLYTGCSCLNQYLGTTSMYSGYVWYRNVCIEIFSAFSAVILLSSSRVVATWCLYYVEEIFYVCWNYTIVTKSTVKTIFSVMQYIYLPCNMYFANNFLTFCYLFDWLNTMCIKIWNICPSVVSGIYRHRSYVLSKD